MTWCGVIIFDGNRNVKSWNREIIHPQSLTWHLKIMMVSNSNLLFQGLIFRWTTLKSGSVNKTIKESPSGRQFRNKSGDFQTYQISEMSQGVFEEFTKLIHTQVEGETNASTKKQITFSKNSSQLHLSNKALSGKEELAVPMDVAKLRGVPLQRVARKASATKESPYCTRQDAWKQMASSSANSRACPSNIIGSANFSWSFKCSKVPIYPSLPGLVVASSVDVFWSSVSMAEAVSGSLHKALRISRQILRFFIRN